MAEQRLIGWEQITIARRIYDYFLARIELPNIKRQTKANGIYYSSMAKNEQNLDLDHLERQMMYILNQNFPQLFYSDSKFVVDNLRLLGKLLDILDPTG